MYPPLKKFTLLEESETVTSDRTLNLRNMKQDTMDERSEKYYESLSDKSQSYKGDITTAYVIGCMHQDVIGQSRICVAEQENLELKQIRNRIHKELLVVQSELDRLAKENAELKTAWEKDEDFKIAIDSIGQLRNENTKQKELLHNQLSIITQLRAEKEAMEIHLTEQIKICKSMVEDEESGEGKGSPEWAIYANELRTLVTIMSLLSKGKQKEVSPTEFPPPVPSAIKAAVNLETYKGLEDLYS